LSDLLSTHHPVLIRTRSLTYRAGVGVRPPSRTAIGLGSNFQPFLWPGVVAWRAGLGKGQDLGLTEDGTEAWSSPCHPGL
jgi:hypothetical protein